ATVVADNAVIAAYGTREDRPAFPFRPLLWANVTIRLLGSDDFPADAKREAASALTTAARDGALSVPIGEPLPLDRSPRRTTASTPARASACSSRCRSRLQQRIPDDGTGLRSWELTAARRGGFSPGRRRAGAPRAGEREAV